MSFDWEAGLEARTQHVTRLRLVEHSVTQGKVDIRQETLSLRNFNLT